MTMKKLKMQFLTMKMFLKSLILMTMKRGEGAGAANERMSLLDGPNSNKKYTAYLGTGKDQKKFGWTIQLPQHSGRNRSCHIVKFKPGTSQKGKAVSTPREAFELFISQELISRIFSNTNKKTEETSDLASARLDDYRLTH